MRYIRLLVVALIIGLLISSSILYIKFTTLQHDYSIAVGNEKALLHRNTELRNDIGVLQLTVDQLSYFNDSLLTKLDSVRRELKIKDKELKYMQYNKTTFEKTDSIVFLKDTIFRDKLHIDTTLHNKWYSLNLTLDYPNSVTVTPKIISEQYLIIRADKETVKPPKKCKLARWFQKKHTVIRAELKEENPYIEHQCSRFVKILDK